MGREHILLAKQIGIPNLVVFMNKCDYDGDEITIIRGSALCAAEGNNPEMGRDAILQLMDAVDEHIPEPERILDKDFLMSVEDTFSIAGRGTVVTGRVEQGIVNVGDDLEVVGFNQDQKTTCTGVEMFRKLLDQGQAGDNIGALLRGLKRGMFEGDKS